MIIFSTNPILIKVFKKMICNTDYSNMENLMDSHSNIKKSIQQKFGKNLHNKKNHPIEIIKTLIYKYFNSLEKYNFKTYDNWIRGNFSDTHNIFYYCSNKKRGYGHYLLVNKEVACE